MALLLKKKAECDAKALKIVEQMMEPQVDVHWLIKSVRMFLSALTSKPNVFFSKNQIPTWIFTKFDKNDRFYSCHA